MIKFSQLSTLKRNLRDLARSTSASTIAAGLVAALVGVAGPPLLVYQAATAAGYPPEVISSWFLAIFVGGGLLSLGLAILYRMPICGAFSIAGSALLIPVLSDYTLPEAVGAFLISGLLVTLIGLSGLFGWVMDRLPQEVVMGMLAGVLLRFGLEVFASIPREPVLAVGMILAYLMAHRLVPSLPAVLVALVGGVAIAGLAGSFSSTEIHFSPPSLVWITPDFSMKAILSLSLPLTLLALVSQNAPGIGILRSRGYRPPSDAITVFTGIGSMLIAPLVGHGATVAAPMTAICSASEASADPNVRYPAAVVQGTLFIFVGGLGATVVSVIDALPKTLIELVAGLALMPVIIEALRSSVGRSGSFFGGGFAFLIGASDLTVLGINSPVWAVVGGILASRFMDRQPTESEGEQ